MTKTSTFIATLFLLIFNANSFSQQVFSELKTENQDIITTDIDNFWTAYDQIVATNDEPKQLELLNKLFIGKGSDGLRMIMESRRYTPQEYVGAINNYPQFWKSIRANTYKSKQLAGELQDGIEQLRKIYPALRPAKIYFTIGVFKTGGTTLEDAVLIGSEVALADAGVITSEFPQALDNLRTYFKTDPIKNIAFNNVHEYIHTQQKTTIGNNLLAQTVLEGVAEFLAVKATKKPSTAPSIEYGKNNSEKVRSKFAAQMFNPFNGFWLYSNAESEFNVRDLGYYVGYEICEKYYDKAADKNLAVKEMIELDYNNELELSRFVDQSAYFSKPLKNLAKTFEKTRPKVVSITELKNGNKKVSSNLKEITINFSSKMNSYYRNFELGPLGESNVLRLKSFLGYSDDGKSATFEIELMPNTHYQLTVGSQFRDENGVSLKPYLIDFVTGK